MDQLKNVEQTVSYTKTCRAEESIETAEQISHGVASVLSSGVA